MKEDEPHTLEDGAVERIVASVPKLRLTLCDRCIKLAAEAKATKSNAHLLPNCEECRKDLRQEIESASCYYFTLSQIKQREQKQTNGFRDRLSRFRRSTDEILQSIESDTELKNHIYEEYIESLPSIDRIKIFCKLIKRMDEHNSRKEKFSSNISNVNWLIGVKLTSVFLNAFGKMPTITNSIEGNPPSGYFVSFAQSVLAELSVTKDGKPYSPHTIKEAFDQGKRQRTRGLKLRG